jgi:hypothetical protein
MCPYFITTTPISFCSYSKNGLFRPDSKRKEKYCLAKFTNCLFFQTGLDYVKIGFLKNAKKSCCRM